MKYFQINSRKWFLISLLLVSFTSCHDFEEINTDPTRMTNINAASLLIQVIYDSGTRSRSYGDVGNYIGQYWTNTSLIDQRHRYDFRGSDSETVYNNIYRTLYDIDDLKKRAETEQLDDYLAAGLILEAYLTTYLTDVFGPVPYSEAMQGDELNFTPRFDSQQAIYEGNLKKLERAYDLLASKPGGNFIRGGDPFYNGDNLKWRKLANGLKLRMYMKMVGIESAVEDQIAALIREGELFSSPDESCAIVYDGRFGLQATQNEGVAGSVAFGGTFARELHETLDPRRPNMAALGIDRDGNPINLDESGNPVFVGVPSGESPDIIRAFDGLSAPYTGLDGVRAPSMLLSHAEIEFYIAEAILNGWVSGDAAEHYEEGIRSSCQWWNVPLDETEAHLAKEEVQLSSEKDMALRQVWKEEYINLYYQGYDGWINYKRVAYPVFHVGSAMLANDIMKRMVYPPLIKSVNEKNYQEAVSTLDKGDDLLSGAWWF